MLRPLERMRVLKRPVDTPSPFRRAISAARAAGGPYLDIPDNLAQTWQDSAGTIPATIGSTVGLLTDRSFGGELGGELVTNSEFDSTASWVPTGAGTTFNVVDGIGIFTVPEGLNAPQLGQTITMVPDKAYAVTVRMRKTTPDIVRFLVGSVSQTVTTSWETYTRVVFAASSSVLVRVQINSSSTVSGGFEIDYFRVRELKGNHATQATAGNRFLLELYNGHPMLRGNGASTSAQFATNPIGPNLSQPYTIIVGGVVGALGANRTFAGDTARGAGINSAGQLRITHHSGSTVVGAASLAQGVAFVAEYVWDGASATIWLNGALSRPATALVASPTAAGNFFVGQRGNSSEFFNGLLLPVFATGSVVPEAQRRAIARGMAQKLGVTYA